MFRAARSRRRARRVGARRVRGPRRRASDSRLAATAETRNHGRCAPGRAAEEINLVPASQHLTRAPPARAPVLRSRPPRCTTPRRDPARPSPRSAPSMSVSRREPCPASEQLVHIAARDATYQLGHRLERHGLASQSAAPPARRRPRTRSGRPAGTTRASCHRPDDGGEPRPRSCFADPGGTDVGREEAVVGVRDQCALRLDPEFAATSEGRRTAPSPGANAYSVTLV